MGLLLVTKREHRFIVIITDYIPKFAKVRALKISVREEVARFVYECIIIDFGIF